MSIEEDFTFVLHSKIRLRVLIFLSEIGFARSHEIADTLPMPKASVSLATTQLCEHDLATYITCGTAKIFSLTENGFKVAQKVRYYYGAVEQ